MRTSIYMILLLSASVFRMNAQEVKKADPVAAVVSPTAAEISFEKDVHDYGTIKQGADGGYEFVFTNTGKDPLVISNAKGSCGCTVPTWPKEPIKSGQKASIKVNYDTNRIGAFSKTVTISSNAKTASKVITIKGVVEALPKDQTTPFKKVEEGGMPFENGQKSF